ncbi:MAG: response regulator [Agathobacter sp.]|nr:response regulator [Agathobacter sp.]
MFIQLFGNFLVEKAVITEEQKVSFQKELQDTRVKMGTIAVADGLINEAQAEEINHAQTQQDRRFGDIAIEMGYLTDAQISDIIKKQGDSAMKFYQLLTDKAGIAMNDIEANLEEFKKAQGFTDEELDALKKDDIDKIISLYAIVRDTDIPDLASLVMRNLIRFVTSDFYFGRMKKVTDYSYSMLAGQWAVGDKKVYLGFGTSDELDGITKLAKKYAKGVTIAGSDEIYDAVCEFTNLNNGLFASALSEKGTFIDMKPPGVFLNQAISGTAYIMPVYIEGAKIDLIISTEADFSEGTKVHEIKVKKSEIKADNTGSKASVLVVDDSALIRKVLIELLNNNGFNVIGEATNGQEGLDMYKELSPDIVTLDVTMPVMDGVEALRQIIELDANAKVAMITAAGQKERLMEALKIGAKLFITKPFNEEEVLNSLSDLV